MEVGTDQDLWDRTVAGDAEAFGELFRRHRSAVYNFCFRRTASWDMAEDLTAQVFVETWQGRASRELVGNSLLPWLIGVASRVISHEWRSRTRRKTRELRAVPSGDTPDPADEVAARVDDERRMAKVLQTLKLLPRVERDVLAVCVFAGLDYQAAAAALGIPVGTVRSRLSRARSHLKRLSAQVTGDNPGEEHKP